MATIYSLICFGGKDGKTVTFTDAGDVVNLTNHGLRDGTEIVFTDNAGNTLPTGLSKNTKYYAKSTASGTFTIYSDSGLTTPVTFTGTGSGTHKVKSWYYYNLSDKSRWTYSTVEYIFDSISAWRTHRVTTVPANAIDTEVCEIGMAWDDALSSVLTLNVGAALIQILPSVAGTYTDAFHNGVYGAGYKIKSSVSFANAIDFSGFYHQMRGVTLECTGSSATGIRMNTGLYNEVANCFLIGAGTGLSQTAYTAGVANTLRNNVVISWATGFNCGSFGSGSGTLYYNNTVAKCTTGFSGSSNPGGFYYNNVAVGCTTAWAATPGSLQAAQYNGSDGGTVWGSNTITTFNTTTHWVDYTNNDLHPTSTSPGKDAGVTIVQTTAEDIAADLRPSYNNGGAEAWDIGAFEYDNGYGLPPTTVALSITNIVDGTRISINKQSDGSEIYNDVPGTSYTNASYTLAGDTAVYVYARKGSSSVWYQPIKLASTITEEAGLSLSLSGLQVEDIAATTITGNVATDWTINWSTGAITHTSGTTRYSVQNLYSHHQNESDTSANIDATPKMYGVTPTQFTLLNDGTITDSDLQDLYGGSVEFQDGTIWANLYTVGTIAGTPAMYIYQGSTLLTSFWDAGHLDILLKTNDAGTPVSSGVATVFARKWGYTFDHYETGDMSAGGRNVAAISTSADPNNTTARATVAAYAGITFTFGTLSRDFGDGDGARTYYCEIDCGGLSLQEVYEYTKYKTDESNTDTLNGVPGKRYLKAHASVTEVKSAPFGTFAGGFWTLAPTVYVTNMAASDQYNYVVTDSTGDTHQNFPALNQSVTVSGATAGSRLQIYDTTSSTELYNGTPVFPYTWEDPNAPVADRAIRVRVTYVSGATAKEMIEANVGTCGQTEETKDVSYLVTQTDDATYNTNAINGSTVTGITINDTTDRVEIAIAGGAVTWASIYAYQVYWLNTASGIQDDFAFIEAPDTANYILTNFKIKNTHATNPLTITGGWGRDATTGLSSTIIDTTSTANIYLAPDHVVPYSTGSGLTAGQDAALTAINGVCSTFTFSGSNVNANIDQVNGTTVTGSGTELDPWGP